MIVDVHGHVTHPELFERFPMPPALADVEGMVEKKAALGIDLTIVGSPVGFGTMVPVPGLDPYSQPLDQLKSFHDWLAETVEAHAGRLAAYAYTNPFGGSELLEQTAETVRSGPFVGLIVNSSVQGRYLDSEEADDFFAMVAELGVPVFLHPGAEPVGTDSVRDFRLVEQVSRFFDVAVSLATLVVSGRLEQYPDLELIAATAGGGVALIFNRLDAVARGRPPAEGVTRAELTRSPSEYLRNVYVDTANQNRASQLANVELMGPERMLFGTDSPARHTAGGGNRHGQAATRAEGGTGGDLRRQRAEAVRARRGEGVMSAGWDDFRDEMQRALGQQVEGDSEPYKALWSQKDPVMVMGAEGGCDRGWEKASAGIDVASRMIQGGNRRIDNLLTIVGDETAVTVDFEHVTIKMGEATLDKTLRCTHGYRVEDGAWKVFSATPTSTTRRV